MKAKLTIDGQLIITPENEVEAYALNTWNHMRSLGYVARASLKIEEIKSCCKECGQVKE